MYGTCPWCGGSIGYGGNLWNIGLMLLFGLLVIAGIVLLVVWVSRSSGNHRQSQTPTQQSDSALETARRRYASGEITKEQYDELRHDLGG